MTRGVTGPPNSLSDKHIKKFLASCWRRKSTADGISPGVVGVVVVVVIVGETIGGAGGCTGKFACSGIDTKGAGFCGVLEGVVGMTRGSCLINGDDEEIGIGNGNGGSFSVGIVVTGSDFDMAVANGIGLTLATIAG